MAGGSVSYQIRVLDEATKELKRISKGFEGLNKNAQDNASGLGKLNKAFGVLKGIFVAGVIAKGIATLTNKIKENFNAWKEQKTAVIKLESALKATGGTVGYTSRQLQSMATEMSSMTGIADETILNAQALMTTFTKVGRETFPKAIDAAADMSEMFEQNLNQSVIQLGTALNDPIAGIGRLKRIGISFTDDQKKMIEGFMAVNDIASAQAVILDELKAEFGGVAEAMGQGPIGAMNNLKNVLVDLNEEWGRTFAESGAFVGAINKAKELVSGFREWLKEGNDKRAYEEGRATDEQAINALQDRVRELQTSIESFEKLSARSGTGDAAADYGSLYTSKVDELNKLIREIDYYKMNMNGEAEQAKIQSEASQIESAFKSELQQAMDYYNKLPKTEIERLEELQREIAATELNASSVQNAEAKETWEKVAGKLQLQADALKKNIDEANKEKIPDADLAKPFRDALAYYNTLPKTEEEKLEELKEEIERVYVLAKESEGATHNLYIEAMRKLQSQAAAMEHIAKNMEEADNSSGKGIMANGLSSVGEALTGLSDIVSNTGISIAGLSAVLNPMNTIITGMMEYLQPTIESILVPLANILRLIGQVAGHGLLPFLLPLKIGMEALGNVFVWVYNSILVPFHNGIQYVFNLIYNGFIAFVRGIIDLVNKIPFVHIRKPSYRDADEYGMLDTISYDDLTDSTSTSTDDSTGTGASYTAGRTLNVDVTVNTEVIAGDLGIRELALWIRDEITNAEALGM